MSELWQWWNLVYVVPLIMAVLYLGVSVTFGLFEGGDADHDADHDMDHDVDHDVDVDADHDVDADGDADHDHDAEADADHGADPAALLLLAIGARQVTAGLALQMLAFTWGLLGMVINRWLAGMHIEPRVFIVPSLLVTGVASIALTRGLSTLLGKLIPKDDSADVRRVDLEGSTAQCLYSIDGDSGVAIVRDKYGHRHQVACRSTEGEIARGAEVILLEYVAQRDYYLVQEAPDEWRPEPRLGAGHAQEAQSVKSDT
ncbi:MAG: DUF1449 family protein [Armatimonadetes bacterium]|nr:DUF1449 family protein [Armatimonadota bacterium]